jgi:hypothetical protein
MIDTGTITNVSNQVHSIVNTLSVVVGLIVTIATYIGGFFHGHKRATNKFAAGVTNEKKVSSV